jgi:uncharacterized protein (DUF4415 family)
MEPAMSNLSRRFQQTSAPTPKAEPRKPVTPEQVRATPKPITSPPAGAKSQTISTVARSAISKKGRPATGNAKKAITIRLDQDVIEALEARENWRIEVNALLRSYLKL